MLQSLHNKLARIGVDVTFIGNYPWVYLDTVNGKQVTGTFQANHGFTAFFLTKKGYEFTNVREVFKKIRETL